MLTDIWSTHAQPWRPARSIITPLTTHKQTNSCHFLHAFPPFSNPKRSGGDSPAPLPPSVYQWKMNCSTVQLVGCPLWYASPLFNQMKPTCDQKLDNGNMQTVYVWKRFAFSLSPAVCAKSLMRRICSWGKAFNSTIKASDAVVQLNPPFPNPWESFTHTDICLSLTSHTPSCRYC